VRRVSRDAVQLLLGGDRGLLASLAAAERVDVGTASYPGYPPGFRPYLRACRTAFEVTRAGRRFAMERFGRPLDLDGWREEFRRALDQRINLRGGLRSDGAVAKYGCRCMACSGRCSCAGCYNSREYRHVEADPELAWREIHADPLRLRRLSCCHHPWGRSEVGGRLRGRRRA
jgi:hypothetical protein